VQGAGTRAASPRSKGGLGSYTQVVAGHFFAVADEEFAGGDNGVVPGFAAQRFEAAAFFEAFGADFGEDGVAFFGDDQQLAGVADEQGLAVAVAAFLPLL